MLIEEYFADISLKDNKANFCTHWLARGAPSLRDFLRTDRYIYKKAEEEKKISMVYSTRNHNDQLPGDLSLISQISERLNKRVDEIEEESSAYYWRREEGMKYYKKRVPRDSEG